MLHLGQDAKLWGGVESLYIADNVSVGANSVVLSSVEEGATAVGVPAKIINKKK